MSDGEKVKLTNFTYQRVWLCPVRLGSTLQEVMWEPRTASLWMDRHPINLCFLIKTEMIPVGAQLDPVQNMSLSCKNVPVKSSCSTIKQL